MPAIRAVALAILQHGDTILVARGRDQASGRAFWRPLGGEIEFGESAAMALAREIEEELGARILEPGLVGVLESVFEYAGRPGHEIVFVLRTRFEDPAWQGRQDLVVVEAGAGWEAVRWVPLSAFESGEERLVPDGLLTLLQTASHP